MYIPCKTRTLEGIHGTPPAVSHLTVSSKDDAAAQVFAIARVAVQLRFATEMCRAYPRRNTHSEKGVERLRGVCGRGVHVVAHGDGS